MLHVSALILGLVPAAGLELDVDMIADLELRELALLLAVLLALADLGPGCDLDEIDLRRTLRPLVGAAAGLLRPLAGAGGLLHVLVLLAIGFLLAAGRLLALSGLAAPLAV